MRIRWMKLLTALFMAVLMAVLPIYAVAEEGAEPITGQQQENGEAQPDHSGEEPEEPIMKEEDKEEENEEEEDADGPAPEESDDEEYIAPQAPRAALAKLRTGGHEPYMNGFSDGRFKPNATITRAEVAQVMYNLLETKPEGASASFSDVSSRYWAYPAIAAMSTLNVMTGTDGRFRPGEPITRAEFVVVLSRCFDLEKGSASFPDVPDTHWAYEAIAAVQQKGWIAGYSNGNFGPDDNLQRCQVARIMNSALERRDDSFAANSDKQKFTDVPKSHWAFKEIAEAAEPVEQPDPPTPPDPPAPGGIQVGSIVQVNSDNGLNVRKAPVDGAIITAVPNGTLLTVTDISKSPWLGIRTQSGVTGFVLGDYVKLYTGDGNSGTQSGSLSASSLSMRQYMSARLDATAGSNVKAMKWTSSNDSVARVGYTINYSGTKQSAIVYAGSPGTAVLTYSDGAGNKKGTCTVTVTAAEPIRFAYPSESIVQKGRSFDLIAITDSGRDGVRFDIAGGPESGSYTTTSYTSESNASEHGLPTNSTKVFKKNVTFNNAGTYTIRAYSSKGGSYSSEYAEFTVQVKNSVSYTEATSETRRLSSLGMREIKNFEGVVHEVEDDRLVAGNPTVGCGYVVAHANDTFYNNLTDTEAYALLVEKADEGVYARAVENFRKKHNIKMSQAQFDALVSWVYNVGTGYIGQDESDAANMILNMVTPPNASASNPVSGVVNTGTDNNPAVLYAFTTSTSRKLGTVPRGASLKIVDVRVVRTDMKQEVWYKTSYNGKTGWVGSGYVKLSGSRQVDLTYADSTSLATELLLWHIAGGAVTPGLVYRRLAECKMFFFGNYNEGNSAAAGAAYRTNTYGFVYPERCAYLDRR